MLANRLKLILNDIISSSQSAFVPGWLISDNVLIAFEMIHFLRKRRQGKDCYMFIKLDMSKSYDLIEWGYLEAVMSKMGFQTKWIDCMMICIKTVSFLVLINGEPKGPIISLHEA